VEIKYIVSCVVYSENILYRQIVNKCGGGGGIEVRRVENTKWVIRIETNTKSEKKPVIIS
jgi:hypothetical protein